MGSKALFFVGAAVVVAGIFLTSPRLDSFEQGRASTSVAIPYDAPRAGAGQLTVEILDPEDEVVGRAEHSGTVAAGKGTWQETVKLVKLLPLDDLAWHRVRYRFAYADQRAGAIEATEPLSALLRAPVVHVVGQQSYLAGAQAAPRVIVSDSRNEVIPGSSTLRIELLIPNQKPKLVFGGALNRRGTLEAPFRFPAGLTGNYQLRYTVDTPIGSTEATQPVRLEDKSSILLTTEKPIYQPGQTIHVRALALNRAQHQASAGRKLIFEVEDSKGNKVFKKVTQTDPYGIASAEFSLADEVNLGTYHIRALMDPQPAEIAVNVERYVLPKFKVAVEFSGKARHGYRPGDRVTGTVRADYFFGKPVEGAEVVLKASTMDVAIAEAGSARGKTDRDGVFRFDFPLAGYFAGRPLTQGAARVLVEATVKDAAGHAETKGQPITVSSSPLLLTAVPEGGTLVPNLDNQVFLLASYPDGTPAVAAMKVKVAGNADQLVNTDAGGVAIVRVRANEATRVLQVEAKDKEGNTASTPIPLALRDGSDQILLHTEQAVYRAGDRIQVKVFSTRRQGAVYIDIVKDGQTVLTRDVDLVNGQAELSLIATSDLAGTLDINAYQFGSDARPAADHRLAFVQPADELKIEAAAGNRVYKPGDEARIQFRVTNSRGEGVQAALGLQVVDEAVFALAEKQPGFAKVFFYLEQEVMKPRYEIHSIGMPAIVEPGEPTEAAQRKRAARALFAATETVRANKFDAEFGRAVPSAKFYEYHQRYQSRFLAQARQLSLTPAVLKTGSLDARDAWGTPLRMERPNWDPQGSRYILRSAGADRRFDSEDDLAALLEVRGRRIAGNPSLNPNSITVNIESGRGAYGSSQITGTVLDQWGGVLEGSRVMVRDLSSNTTRTATVNGNGQFTFAGLAPGDYEIRTSDLSRQISLKARDRAAVSIVLRQDSGISVAVTDFPVFRQMMAKGGVVGGAPGGVIGGVMGGIVRFRAAMPAAAPMAPMLKTEPSNLMDRADRKEKKDAGGQAEARVRSYFPEALYINPEIITDGNGKASVTIRVADSITTWRMAMLASTARGALGSGTSSLKVFQDFFVDLDLPVTLTQGDRVSLPVAVYNYSPHAGNVSLKLSKADWFSLVEDSAEKNVAVDPDRVGGTQFTLEAKRIGKFKLMLNARMGALADIVVREIEVVPNGREQNLVFNGRIESSVEHDLHFPNATIPDSTKILVRLYPGPLSQVIEGMDSILRMPGGCFEQTSSSTYPNVLALDYMKRTKKLTPEVRAKAEGFIANGYQRLLTFEVPGGGFSWFGNPPANKILTAYGLMEFSDMAKVYDVDSRLIQRTQQWLASQQQPNGSWKPDTQFINEGATNRYNSDLLRITAYLGWSLKNTGYNGPAVDKARQYVVENMRAKADPYTLAVIANFAVDYAADREFTRRAMQQLLDARAEKEDKVWWQAEETAVYARGESAAIETTGLALQAVLKWGGDPGTSRKALSYIASKKDASGNWATTQGTIMALRALLLATEKGSSDVKGDVEITLNGKPVEHLTVTADNNDLLHQFVLKGADTANNRVGIRFNGKGTLAYQIVGRHFLPWGERPAAEPMSIEVTYDRTRLAQDDIATATATVKNNLRETANMVMVDLGIPPGFDLLSEDLQSFVERTAGRKGGRLEKFSLTPTQAILYFDSIAPGGVVNFNFRLRAKYPIRARTFQSRVYEYYDPSVNAVARPVQFEVRKR